MSDIITANGERYISIKEIDTWIAAEKKIAEKGKHIAEIESDQEEMSRWNGCIEALRDLDLFLSCMVD